MPIIVNNCYDLFKFTQYEEIFTEQYIHIYSYSSIAEAHNQINIQKYFPKQILWAQVPMCIWIVINKATFASGPLSRFSFLIIIFIIMVCFVRFRVN